jgi:AraC family transcriptional regulator
MDEVSPLIIEGLSLEMIAETARRKSATTEGRRPRWLLHARDIIHSRFVECLRLAQIAEQVGVHPVYLASEFRKHFGCTIGEYVRKLRVEFACRRISESDSPLSDIAIAAGFSHQSHFSRTFKAVTGMTPAGYRTAVH